MTVPPKPKSNLDRAKLALASIDRSMKEIAAPAVRPFLRISDDCIISPSKTDVLIIERAMLWPTSKALQTLPPVQAWEWGFLAGYKLRKIVGLSMLRAPDATSEKVTAAIGNLMKRKGFRSISEKTITNQIWPQFRSVAYLWASYYHRSLNRDGADAPFPCRVAELRDFLAVAEAFRLYAEVTRTAVRSRTILTPGTSIALPAGLSVPAVALDFELATKH
jgi:hypothetical protein